MGFASLITIAVIAVITATAGCGSLAADLGASPSGTAGSPIAPPCLTKKCIAQDIQQSLVGSVAKDESVITKVTCKASSVKRNAGNTWTAKWTATYSDGGKVAGYGNLLPAQDKVTFEPASLAGQ